MYINLPVMHHDGVLVESVQHANSQVHHLTFYVYWKVNTLAPCLDRYLYGGRDSKKQQDRAIMHAVQAKPEQLSPTTILCFDNNVQRNFCASCKTKAVNKPKIHFITLAVLVGMYDFIRR